MGSELGIESSPTIYYIDLNLDIISQKADSPSRMFFLFKHSLLKYIILN